MKRSSLLVVLLGFMAPFLAHAEEPSVCASMCTSEKQQCTSRAAKMTELDDRPSVEDTNPMTRAGERGQVISEAARVAQRDAAQRRSRERIGACTASFKRCTSSCTPLAAPVVEQAAQAK